MRHKCSKISKVVRQNTDGKLAALWWRNPLVLNSLAVGEIAKWGYLLVRLLMHQKLATWRVLVKRKTDCKKRNRVLSETEEDIVKTQEFLRKKGLARAYQKVNRAVTEVWIGSHVHDSWISILIVTVAMLITPRGDINALKQVGY